jgi:predicted ATPase
MAIQELKVHGYRSFRDVCWQPGKLNLLVGPNASGKSNLLRLLELIGEAAKGQLANAMKTTGIVPLLRDYQSTSLDWTIHVAPVDIEGEVLADGLTSECRLEHLRNTSSYQIALDTLGLWSKDDSLPVFWVYRRDLRAAMVFDRQATKLAPFPDPDPSEILLPQISDPRTNPIPAVAQRIFKQWRIYHDLHVERGSPMRLPATTQVAKLVEADGSNLVSVLHTLYTGNRDFKRQIDEGMQAGFGDQFEELVFQPAAAQQIQLAIQWKSSKRPHAGQDLSDGTLRFLFLLTVLASPEPATLVAIDEPEVGLHPSMLPIIAEYAADAASRTQVIMTSHSPVFLDAFSKVGPQVTLLHWENGETHFFPLAAEAMAKWLEEYRLGQLFTSGDLEGLAHPPVEAVPELAERAKSLPREDEAVASAE